MSRSTPQEWSPPAQWRPPVAPLCPPFIMPHPQRPRRPNQTGPTSTSRPRSRSPIAATPWTTGTEQRQNKCSFTVFIKPTVHQCVLVSHYHWFYILYYYYLLLPGQVQVWLNNFRSSNGGNYHAIQKRALQEMHRNIKVFFWLWPLWFCGGECF